MQLLALQNFRSYQEQVVNNLSPRINVLLGGNGQGKSNLFKAIRFLLTSATPLKLSYFRANKHESLLREDEPKPTSVEAYIRSQSSGEDLIKVQRMWESEAREELRIEEGVYSRRGFDNALEAVGYPVSNPYNIIEQGTIGQVANMTPSELLTLLHQVAGIKKVDLKISEMKKSLEDSSNNREKAQLALEEVEQALRGYQVSVEEMDQYLKVYKCDRVRAKLRLTRDQARLKDQAVKVKASEQQASEELNQLKTQLKAIHERQEEAEVELQIAQRELEGWREAQGFRYSTPLVSSQSQRQAQAQLSRATEAKSSLSLQLREQNRVTERLREEMEPYRLKYEAVKAQSDKQQLKAKGAGKQELRETISRLQEQVREAEEEMKKLGALKEGLKVQGADSHRQKLRELEAKTAQASTQLRQLEVELYKANRAINHAESQIQVHSGQAEACFKRVRKALPLLDPRLTHRPIEGVYGYLADFLDLTPSTAYLYEVAGLKALCTLIVEDGEACKRVAEVNRKLRGAKVMMVTLSVLRKQTALRRVLPGADQEVYSLVNQDWVKVRRHGHGPEFTELVNKMVSNAFGGHVLVKDYEVGLRVSKEHQLSCITPDREVINPGAFYSKIGKPASVEDRLDTYQTYSSATSAISEAKICLESASKQRTILLSSTLQATKRLMNCQTDKEAAQRALHNTQQLEQTHHRIATQIEGLTHRKARLVADAQKQQEFLETYDRSATTVSEEALRSAHLEYSSRHTRYAEAAEQEAQLEVKLRQVERNLETLSQEQRDPEGPEGKVEEEAFYRSELKESVGRHRQAKERAAEEAREVRGKLERAQKKDFEWLDKLAAVQSQLEYCEGRLRDIGDVGMTEEEMEEIEVSMSMSREHSRPQPMISPQHQVVCQRLQRYQSKLTDKKAETAEWASVQARLSQSVEQLENRKQRQLRTVFEEFQRHFKEVFEFLTGGSAEARMRQGGSEGQGARRSHYGLEVRVGWGEGLTSWGEMSGGQKTLVALSVLMALQRCSPAPYYVLDEIDAALDQAYLPKVVQLIERESQRAQFFISTFKKSMASFGEEAANYYLVEAVERVSSVRQVSKEEVPELIDMLMS